MEVITLEAQPRSSGKSAARAARREGNVPCVLYGSHVEPVAFKVEEMSLKPLIYTNETHLVEIQVDGDSWECIVKDIAFHPVSDRPMHVDFQVLQKGEKVTLSIPVRYIGTPKGQTEGGQTSFVINELLISCLPKDIPSHIDVEVSDLAIGDTLHVGDLDLGDVEIHASPQQTLVTVVPPRMAAVDEEEAEGLLLEGEEGEEIADEAEGEGDEE